MRIEETITYNGEFYFPYSDNKSFTGSIEILDSGEIELELIGDFGLDMHGKNTLLIIGVAPGAGYLTLINSYLKSIRGGMGPSTCLFSVQQLVKGIGFEKDENIEFIAINFSFVSLDSWLQFRLFEIQSSNDIVQVTYNIPPKKTYLLHDGFRLEFNSNYTSPINPSYPEAKISHTTYFKLLAPKPTDINSLKERTSKICQFISFFINNIITIKNVSLIHDKLSKQTIGENKQFIENFKTYFRSYPYLKEDVEIHPNALKFKFSFIEDTFENLINNWFQFLDNYKTVMDLYFSVKSKTIIMQSDIFLALSKALETLASRRFPKKSFPNEDDFIALKNKLVEVCPDEKKEWFIDKFGYANENTLREKFDDLLVNFEVFIESKTKRTKILNKLIDTRNYLTHRSLDLEKRSATDREMYYLNKVMIHVLRINIFKIIEIPDQLLEQMINEINPIKDYFSYGRL